MNTFKKVLYKVRDVFEIYIPICAFIVMFMTFVVQIISRYVFKFPLTWAYEVTVIGFSWTVILGACYAMRQRNHVKFTLIYDMLSPKMAALTRLAGNVIIFVTFLLLIQPSMEYVSFMGFQSTSVFKIKLSWIFSVFVYFVVSIIGYTLSEIWEDIMILVDRQPAIQESSEY